MKLKLNKTISCVALTTLCLSSIAVRAQLSSNPDKFLGNITTSYQVDYGSEKFYTLWNQITCENESKWDVIEGGARGSFTFGNSDKSANYAKKYGFPFKYHTLIWGAQYPKWMDNLSTAEQYKAIVEYFDAVKKHYPNLEIIDVVNEAIVGHQPAPYKAALGGDGRTGFDWIVKAFQLAHERWPNAILVYNDFNTFQWQKTEFINLVRTLRDAGAPVDAYGCQSHDITDMSLNMFTSAMTEIQNALKMPMYSTEFDIGTADDTKQETQYKNLFSYLWEADYCAGVTLWGYIYGHTWTTNGNSGLIKEIKENGKTVYEDRPAMTWLRDYMKSDKAKNAKSPFPGFKKEASLYVKPASLKVAKGDSLPVLVDVAMATKTIEKVELYVNNVLEDTKTEAPYLFQLKSTKTTGTKTLKAVVTATDGSTYERLSRITVQSGTTVRKPYKDVVPELPGIVNAMNYDQGIAGVSYNNASRTGVTKTGGWMEYTVDVKEDGVYALDVEVASQTEGLFHLVENDFGNLKFLSDFLTVPNTGSASEYKLLHSVLTMNLTAGRHVLSLIVDKGGFNVKNMTFSRYEEDKTMTVNLSTLKPATVNVGDTTTITLTAKTATTSGKTIAKVDVYANNLLIGTLNEAPYSVQFVPLAKGKYTITAIATDSEGKIKNSTNKKSLKVNGKRIPYKSTPIVLPGIIQAEDFDMGGDGLSFHDSDSNNEGDASYRTDNEGLDLVKGNGGTAIGYTANNEWTEYTVNVKEPGEYSFEATCSNGSNSDGGFTISTLNGSTRTQIGKVTVTPTGGWGTYQVMNGKLTKNLAEGEQILRFTISGANCNIDKVKFICTLNTGIQTVVTAEPERTVIYNLKGQKVDANYKGIVIRNGRKVLKR